MKLALMPGDLVPNVELRDLGFHAIQMFFGGGVDGDGKDPSRESIQAILNEGGIALAAMTLHVDLVDSKGVKSKDVARLVRCIEKTGQLDGLFGDNVQPILVWHPSGYPSGEQMDDSAVFEGLNEGLAVACSRAEELGVLIAVEITRAGSVGSAETYLRLRDRISSPALKVCIDAANFVPDRTPLDRAVRILSSDIVIAHGKDASFRDNGEVEDYGPTGSGRLDYGAYISLLKAHTEIPYFVLEYYRSREDLIRARDIVRAELNS